MTILHITPIEYPDKGYFLAIGKVAPWDRKLQLRVPKRIFNLFCGR